MIGVFSVALLLLAILGVLWSTKVESETEARLTPADKIHISEMKYQLSDLSGKELLVMRDSTIYKVLWTEPDQVVVMRATGYVVRLRILWSREYFDFLRVVRPHDPEYPKFAVRFLTS